MPFTPREPDDGEQDSTPGFIEEGGTWVGVNEDMLDGTDWEDPNAVQSAQGSGAPLTIIRRSPGRATVRTNRTMTFSGGIPFAGQVSGSVPAGAVLSGGDRNGNGVPDVLERGLRDRTVIFPGP